MRPNPRFLSTSLDFWADVRLISQQCGYKIRGKDAIVVPTPKAVASHYTKLGLRATHLVINDTWTDRGTRLHRYFRYRAQLLQETIRPALMNLWQAQALYQEQVTIRRPKRQPPMNKQKGDKNTPAYLTALVNMLIEDTLRKHHYDPSQCDYDPRSLSVVTHENAPFRILGRRFDGAFPSTIDPVAIWEIKEYYHTTSFGSRIADGVYVSKLDGMELNELYMNSSIYVRKYLIIDAYDTWWNKGISFLCRIVDMMHMGYLDELIVGREVIERIPNLVGEWIKAHQLRITK